MPPEAPVIKTTLSFIFCRSRFYADPEGEPSVPYGASKYAELPFVEADSR